MPTTESINKLKIRRLRQRKAADREAQILGKSKAITADLMAEMAEVFGVDLNPDSAEGLVQEHKYFENAMTPSELERFSNQTVVGVGQHKGRGYILVLNLDKKLKDENLDLMLPAEYGLGFPGGRVRIGESPVARLKKETVEETKLVCEVLNPDQPPVSQHKVGELEHLFSAYAFKIISGRAQANPTRDEPIIEVVYVDEKTLIKLCSVDRARIIVKSGGQKYICGVLRSHRLVFMEYLRKKYSQESVVVQTTSVKEVTNV